ncbi:hypothetical protein O181_016956 [Austropuccinia psidii MF-1]|uniref:Uncharacterized protein n=1 Tax=Austropuccinia psidii MF-1 TaxID=1389203 RepID=A0A9Q3C2N0_9BASI|nr:hypothetical protein [Austropuccinia psidii MF-1]
MDLHQEVQVINAKDKNVSSEERHKIEDSRASTSYQRSRRDIPVSVKELFYGRKAAGVGTSSKPLDRENELISSSEEVLRPRKERGPSERLDSNVLQRESLTDKILVEKPKEFFRGSEGAVFPKEGQQPCGSSPRLHKCQIQPKKAQRITRRAIKRQRERESPNVTRPTLRATEFQRRERQPWTMCSIWQELRLNSETRRRNDPMHYKAIEL